MPLSIAVAGKGGTGKTTLSALILLRLIALDQTPVLAVDADPNHNLGESLALDISQTIGSMREEFYDAPDRVPPGMDKSNYLQMQMNRLLIERKHFDLLVMGRQEGPGCYCFANNILRRFLDELSDNYKSVLTDNEAGMEHLSRRTNGRVDHLWIVADPSPRGLRAASRIVTLIDELKLDVGAAGLIVNRVKGDLDARISAEINALGLPLLAVIPDDPMLTDFDLDRRSLLELPDDAPSMTALKKAFDHIFEREN